MNDTTNALFPPATLRLITHFLLHPDHRLHFRALHRHTGIGIHSLQRELARLESHGLVQREEEGRHVVYTPVLEHPSWGAFRTLVRQHSDPATILREALQDVEGIDAAFIFGSFARGSARSDSDVDLFVVGDERVARSLGKAVMEAQVLLGRAIDLKRYTPEKLAQRLRRGTSFIHEALTGPQQWVAGDPQTLGALAAS